MAAPLLVVAHQWSFGPVFEFTGATSQSQDCHPTPCFGHIVQNCDTVLYSREQCCLSATIELVVDKYSCPHPPTGLACEAGMLGVLAPVWGVGVDGSLQMSRLNHLGAVGPDWGGADRGLRHRWMVDGLNQNAAAAASGSLGCPATLARVRLAPIRPLRAPPCRLEALLLVANSSVLAIVNRPGCPDGPARRLTAGGWLNHPAIRFKASARCNAMRQCVAGPRPDGRCGCAGDPGPKKPQPSLRAATRACPHRGCDAGQFGSDAGRLGRRRLNKLLSLD